MELIKTLTVTDFPGVKNWKYDFSQDVLIEWASWTWKTSLLKALSWLFAWTDLQWNAIPNILDTTKITSRWTLSISKEWKWKTKWRIDKILAGSKKEILARIVPWFLFSWGFSTKEIVKALTHMDIDTMTDWAWKTISSINKEIKDKDKCIRTVYRISEKIYVLNSKISKIHYWNNVNLNPSILTFTDLHGIIGETIDWVLIKELKDLKETYEYDFAKNKIQSAKKLLTILKSKWKFINDIINVYINSKDKTIDAIKVQNAIQIIGLLWITYGECSLIMKWTWYISTLKSNYWLAYDAKYLTLIKETFMTSLLKVELKALKERIIKKVNNSLEGTWILLTSLTNIVCIIEDASGNNMSLLELPSSERFLYEVMLCSRLQTKYINGNASYWEANILWGILLIDNYMWDINDEDTIDLLLWQCQHHQTFITWLSHKQKTLSIKI